MNRWNGKITWKEKLSKLTKEETNLSKFFEGQKNMYFAKESDSGFNIFMYL